MVKIGNIVSKNKINVGNQFNYDIVDESLPTLFIGKPEGFKLNPINRKIDNLNYWTYLKNQERGLYQNDLYNFIDNSLRTFISGIVFYDVNFLKLTNSSLIKLYKVIKKIDITYEYNDILYCYSISMKILFIVDLNKYKFLGGKYNKLRNNILYNSKEKIKGFDVLIEYKDTLDVLNNEYVDYKVIPIIFYIKKNE
jgi:hypothetical protein